METVIKISWTLTSAKSLERRNFYHVDLGVVNASSSDVLLGICNSC